MGPIARRLSVASRLSLLVVLVAIVALAVTAVVALDRGGTLLRDGLAERLSSVAAGRADQAARHVNALRDGVLVLATSPATAAAITDFAAARAELGQEPVDRDLEDRLAAFYLDQVVPGLEEVRGRSVAVSPLLPVTDAAIRLQSTWVTAGDGEVAPSAVDDNDDGTAWTELHARLHPAYRRIATQAGFTDLAFVSADQDVVYTVAKGIDLGTDLDAGPHSGGVLAVTVREIAADPRPGQVVVGDLARTQAAGDRPVGVVAAPVFEGTRFVGVVAGQFDAGPLTDIMAAGGDWTGLGETGQAYLAAGDDTMRTDARAFVADPAAWLDGQTDQLTPEQARAMRVLGTTVTHQPIDSALVAAAASGPGTGPAVGPSGSPVVAGWHPVDVEGLDWTAVAEVGRDEVEQPVRDFGRAVIVALALFVVAVTFLAVAWANRLVDPLRRVAARLREVRGHEVGVPLTPSEPPPPRAPQEYRELAGHIEEMLARLVARGRELQRRRDERFALLRQFLPPTMASRAEAGERDVLDRAERASVVVLELRGLGALVRDEDRDDARDVLGGLVDDLDTAARHHGLERFRLNGNTWFAVCGASRPQLDHAPRSLAFARQARELVADVAAGTDEPLGVTAGLASGPVTVGLTGGDRLVHDCWGPTVDRAVDLARSGTDGELLVDEAARLQLPDQIETATPDGPRPHGAVRVVDQPEPMAAAAGPAGPTAGPGVSS